MASNVPDDLKVSDESQNPSDNSSSESSQSSLVSKLPGIKFFKDKVKKPSSGKISKGLYERSYWDPLASADWDSAGPPNHFVSTRVKRDLAALFKEPLPGIFAIPDEKNFCLVHCLILGPFETPYEGGFFNFAVRFGPSYPIHPPRVRLLTTGGGKVRFNPNLYSNGKVCLSILGTWNGPLWSPALNLGSLLLSIQSLLNDKPYFNEPGFKTEHYYGESDKYNVYLTHETIRISVCYQLEQYYYVKNKKFLPLELAEVMKESFLDLFGDYIETCNKYKHVDGQTMRDIFGGGEGLTYSFSNLITRLNRLKEVICALKKETKEKEKDSSLSSISDDDEYDKSLKASTSLPMPTTYDKYASKETTTVDEDLDLFYDEEEDEDLEDEEEDELKEENKDKEEISEKPVQEEEISHF